MNNLFRVCDFQFSLSGCQSFPRSAFSIALILSLLPLWQPGNFGASQDPMLCHRSSLAHHHCGIMGSHHDAADIDRQVEPAWSAAPSAQCPMHCCCLALSPMDQAIAGTVITSIQSAPGGNVVPPLAIFARPGFSSHADRGPPV